MLRYIGPVGITVYTVGHSTRSWQEFTRLLSAYGIQAVVDVRAFPSSRKFPHFSREALARGLEMAGMEYLWLGRELGGYRRHGLGAASPNTAWRAGGFRNYADHMLGEEFARGIERVLALARRKTTALLCAERFWWRCHRRLISDFLVAQGHRVIHILEQGREVEHQLPPFARVVEGRLVYPGGDLFAG